MKMANATELEGHAAGSRDVRVASRRVAEW
jgi:hypothetical protein